MENFFVLIYVLGQQGKILHQIRPIFFNSTFMLFKSLEIYGNRILRRNDCNGVPELSKFTNDKNISVSIKINTPGFNN
jgi:hypothetical protein